MLKKVILLYSLTVRKITNVFVGRVVHCIATVKNDCLIEILDCDFQQVLYKFIYI